MLAVVRHLETRLALRDFDLRGRARLAGILVRAFGDGERIARARPRFRGLENRARDRERLVVEPRGLIGQLVAALRESNRQRVGVADFLLHALAPPLELTVMLGGPACLDLRRLERGRRGDRRALGLLRRRASRVRDFDRRRPRFLRRRQLGAQREQLGAAPERAGAADEARQPDRAAHVDERGAVVHRARVTEKSAHPRAHRARRVDAMRKRIRTLVGDERVRDRVQRKEQQRPGVRRRVPRADVRRDRHVAHDDRVNRGAEEAFDEQRRRFVGVDEIAERAEHRALAEAIALAKQARRGRSESDALALQRVERVDPSLDRRVRFVGAEQLGARRRLAFARLAIGRARAFERRHRFGDATTRVIHDHRRVLDFAGDGGQRVGELRALLGQLLEALHQLVALLARPLAFDVDASRTILQLSVRALDVVDRRAAPRDHLPRLVLALLALGERPARRGKHFVLPRAIVDGELDVRRESRSVGHALRGLRLGALATRRRVSLALFRHLHLGADLERLLALAGHEAKQLGALRFGRRAIPVRRVARLLGRADRSIRLGSAFAQCANSLGQSSQLVVPRFHLALGERQLDGEPSRVELRMLLGAAPLSRERTHLALHFVDQIVEPLQVDRRLVEPPLRRATAVAIESDARRFLEQLAPVVRPIREERVDHLALDDDAGVGAEAGAAQQIGDVAEPAWRAIQEVVALARPGEPARDDDFLERDRQRAVFVREVERDLGDVHRAPRRRSLEDDFFHLRAAQQPRALFAEHPPHRVRHVRLAAPVRPDDRRHPGIELHLRGVSERLEALQLELGQSH